MMETLTSAVLVVVCAGAVWFDLRERRIPNLLTVGAFAAALALRAATGGWPYLASGLVGALIAFSLSLPFFLAGGLGGGDVKLLTALGAFLGLGDVVEGLLATGIVGGIMAVVVMLFHRGLFRQTLANLHTLFLTLSRRTFTGWKAGEENEAILTLDSPGAVSLPYALAISAGALLAWFVL